ARRRRLQRAHLGGQAALSLRHRQPASGPHARARAGLAYPAYARCACDASGRAAARRQARLHHLPLDRMPGEVTGEDARSARRRARGRSRLRHRLGAFVPAQPGALDGRLAGHGGRWQMERGRSRRRARRARPHRLRPGGAARRAVSYERRLSVSRVAAPATLPICRRGASQEHAMSTYGSAIWSGGIKDGKGAISTKSGALKDYTYGFASRFEGKQGSNPEELIGAAHAACFTMALSLILGEAKLTAEKMETKADVTLEKQADGYAITAVHLTLR